MDSNDVVRIEKAIAEFAYAFVDLHSKFGMAQLMATIISVDQVPLEEAYSRAAKILEFLGDKPVTPRRLP